MFCVEEQPLDLSVKPQKCDDGYDSYLSSSQHFNFEEFYRRYLAISVRSWHLHHPQPPPLPLYTAPLPESSLRPAVKRKLSSEFDEVAVAVKKPKSEDAKHDAKSSRIIRKRKKDELSLIKSSCDCRSCYEEHINKLRVKSEVSWTFL